MYNVRSEGAGVDQHETRTDGEGQEETQAIGEPPQSAQPDEVKPDPPDEESSEVSAEAGSEPWPDGGDQPPDVPFEVSLRVGAYVVERSLGDDSRRVYVAHEAPAAAEADKAPRPELLVESATTDSEAVEEIVALHLRHPCLLAPRALVRPDERAYLAYALPQDVASDEIEVVGSAAPLTPLDTLKAGVGLADALAYLHRSGVVHQGVAPGAFCLLRGRAYLVVLASGALAPADDAERSARFAQDVSALAQALAALAEAPSESPVVPMSPEESLRDLIARGTQGDFQTAEELQAACGAAVQLALHGVAGAIEMDATVRVAFRAGSATSVGRVRSQNQDAAAIATFDVVDDVAGDMPVGVFLVADGMGGEARGELASRLGARVVASQMAQYFMLPSMTTAITNPLGNLDDADETPSAQDDVGLAQTLANAVAEANTQVRALAEALGEATGSTITAVAISGVQAAIAHLGDSRAYLLHGDTMVRMTEDHSLLARLEAMDHPLLHDPAFAVPRNFLYRSLGQEEEAPPDILEFRVQPGDRMMICSDGLWDEVDDKQIAQILALSRDPETCAQALVRLANEGGGHDNSTAVVVFVEEVPPDSAASMERIEWQDSDLEIESDEDTSGQEADATPATNGGEA
jgi:PPM family protein phosphatase